MITTSKVCCCLILLFASLCHAMEPEIPSHKMEMVKKYGYIGFLIKHIGISFDDQGSTKTFPFPDAITDQIINYVKLHIPKKILDLLTIETTLPNPSFEHKEKYTCIAHNPCKLELAAGTSHEKIIVWNVAQCTISNISIPAKKPTYYAIKLLTYNPEGTELAFTSENKIKILNLTTNTINPVFQLENELRALVFNHDGTKLISSSSTRTNTLTIWNLHNNEATTLHTYFKSYMDWLIRSKCGKKFASKDGSFVAIWKIENEEHAEENNGCPSQTDYYSATFNHDDSEIALGAENGHVRLWNLNTLVMRWIEYQPSEKYKTIEPISALAYCPTNDKIFTTSETPVINSLNLQTHQIIPMITHNQQWIRASAFNEDGDKVAQIVAPGNVITYTNLIPGQEVLDHYTIDQLLAIAKNVSRLKK